MTAGWCCRAVRAAVFAAVCVLLAALGHAMMSATSVPWWALGAGAVGVGATAWALAGRERGLLPVVSVAVAAQAALHAGFSLAQAVARPAPDGTSLARQWARYMLCGPSSDAGSMGRGQGSSMAAPMSGSSPMPDMPDASSMASASASSGSSVSSMASSMQHMGESGHMHHMGGGHDMAGMSPTGMLTAHLLAALLCGLWLAHGERAAFRIARSFAGWLVAPLRVPLVAPAPAHRPRVRPHRRSARRPRQFLLVHAITSRGPPAGTAVA